MEMLRLLLKRWEEEHLSEEEFKALLKYLNYAKDAVIKELDGYEQERKDKIEWEEFIKKRST